MLSKELKQKWVDALRSGQYKKTTGKLKALDEDGDICHCNLGVLCDVAGFKFAEEPDQYGEFDLIDDTGEHIFTYSPIRALFDDTSLMEERWVEASFLANDNISHPKTFEQLADWVEENIPTEG